MQRFIFDIGTGIYYSAYGRAVVMERGRVLYDTVRFAPWYWLGGE